MTVTGPPTEMPALSHVSTRSPGFLPLLVLLLMLQSSFAFLVPFPFFPSRSSRRHASDIGPAPGPTSGPAPGPPPGSPDLPPPPSKGILTIIAPDGKELSVLEVQPGANLRKTLQAAKVDVYDLISKMTNCNGAGQCGTCVVKVTSLSWGIRSEYEASKILKGGKFGDGEEYRLACQTLVEAGEATIMVRPPKKGK